MKVPFLDLKRENDLIRNQLDNAISRVIGNGNFILGEEVLAFEREFSEYLKVKHCITCGNGTDALELALQVLEIGPKDEVIVPAFGWLSAALAVIKAGAVPVFVDAKMETANIDPQAVEKAITERTKAVVGIHLFGLPCDVHRLLPICKGNKLFFIEDCSQAHGAEVKGVKVGNFGDIATFSFYPTKNLGCLGDGGALTTNSDEIANKLFSIRNYGKSGMKYVLPGRNSRLDELQAAILREKLKFLDDWNHVRRRVAMRYNEQLKIFSMETWSDSVFYRIHTLVANREGLTANLQKVGVQYAVTEGVTSNHPVFGLHSNADVASSLASSLVALPLFIGITDKEIDFCCKHIFKLLKSNV